jgi:two-component system, NtrC family, response regulator HydG
MVEEGSFRFDLYYRLNVFPIQLPPLRERKEDIPVLVDHFIRKFSSSMKKEISGVTLEAMAVLSCYHWPGNVRELENAVERAMVLARTTELREQDFSLRSDRPASSARTLDEMERVHILAVLEECRGNQTLAAQVLDIDRVTLHNKLKKYGWKKVTTDS